MSPPLSEAAGLFSRCSFQQTHGWGRRGDRIPICRQVLRTTQARRRPRLDRRWARQRIDVLVKLVLR